MMDGNNSQANGVTLSPVIATQQQLRGARIEYPERSFHYITPWDAINTILPIATVKKILQSSRSTLSIANICSYAERICKSPGLKKLFAALILRRIPERICAILDENIDDNDLPFKRTQNKTHRYELIGRSGKHIREFDSWDDEELEELGKNQKMMNVIMFEKQKHYDVDEYTNLPFIPFGAEEEHKQPKEGGYAKVLVRRIHPSHHNFWNEADDDSKNLPLVAIKVLYSSNDTDFHREQAILQHLGNSQNPHLVELLCTYKHDGQWHLMFHFANSNLRQYWKEHPNPTFDEKTLLWSLNQIKGITKSISVIHNFKVDTVTTPLIAELAIETVLSGHKILKVNKGEEVYGRHGDIKPENMLWFHSAPGIKEAMGILQLADFGLGRFHGRDSRSNRNPANIVTSPTYEPPECHLERPVSREYDMWSLGCVFLEFITWLLKGSDNIYEFSRARGKTQRYGRNKDINDDNFFTVVKPQGGGPLRAEVREEVLTWVEKLHKHEKCSGVIHDILTFTMDNLLVVEREGRVKAKGLCESFQSFYEKSVRDKDYLLKPETYDQSLMRYGQADSPKQQKKGLGWGKRNVSPPRAFTY